MRCTLGVTTLWASVARGTLRGPSPSPRRSLDWTELPFSRSQPALLTAWRGRPCPETGQLPAEQTHTHRGGQQVTLFQTKIKQGIQDLHVVGRGGGKRWCHHILGLLWLMEIVKYEPKFSNSMWNSAQHYYEWKKQAVINVPHAHFHVLCQA